MPDPSIASRIDSGVIDDDNIRAIEKSFKTKESKFAPSTQEQLGSFVDWKTIRDALGQPFDAERVPVKKLRQQRRDSMFAFGLHYRKTPLVRAGWHMEATDRNGPNAQIAGFMDAAWRPIHARYIFQHTTDFDFGFAPIVKRFQEAIPQGYYVDPTEQDPAKALKPVWDEGSVMPITWKPFIGLPPERVQPMFNDDGEFDGILYEKNPANQGGRTGALSRASKKAGSANDRELPIDVYHALWATNDKDSVFGSIFGYPLIAHGYRYWWSYWYLWANIDRAFERMAVPPILAYHPEGSYVDDDGVETPHYEIALAVAESLRSNAVAAVPSTLATAGLDERGTQQREWAFEYMETPNANFEVMHKHLNYLDVMKLRSIWVPEQAFIEGEGGTSSRNVAAQMGEIFMESQANKWEEIADHINRYILPQLLAVNFPEFVKNGGTCRIVGHGFSSEDTEFMKQVLQLIGQSTPEKLADVDVRKALERINVPLLTPAQMAAEQQQLVEESGATGPGAVDTQNIQTVPNTGFTNGGSAPGVTATSGSVTGFADVPEFVYANPQESIALADHDDFLTGLPPTAHYADKQMRAYAVQLRALWIAALKDFYPDFATKVQTAKFEFSKDEHKELVKAVDEDLVYDVVFADDDNREKRISKTKATRVAKKLLKEWSTSNKKLDSLRKRSAAITTKMVKRAAQLSSKKRGKTVTPEDDVVNEFVAAQVEQLVKKVVKTTKDNMESALIDGIMDGKTPEQVAKDLNSHFGQFPEFRADRIARSETRDAFNAGTLIDAKAAGLRYVRAKDAQHGPTDEFCQARDGKLYTIREAWNQMSWKNTHPNDTLEFEPQERIALSAEEMREELIFSTLEFEPVERADFSIESVKLLPEEAGDGPGAWFNQKTGTAYVPLDMSDDEANEFLDAVVEHINSGVPA